MSLIITMIIIVREPEIPETTLQFAGDLYPGKWTVEARLSWKPEATSINAVHSQLVINWILFLFPSVYGSTPMRS